MINKSEQATSELPKSVLRNFLIEAGSLNILVLLTSGVFITGYLLLLGANNLQIGLIISIPLFASVFTPVISYFIDRSKNRKGLCLKTALLDKIFWTIAAAIPILVYYKCVSFPLAMFSLLFIVGAFFKITSMSSWLPWMADLIPSSQRGYYFGKRMFVTGLVAMVFGFAGGRYMDMWKSNEYFGFSSLFGFASLFGFIAYFYLRKIPDVLGQPPAGEQFSIMTIPNKVLAIRKNKNFMSLVWYNASFSFVFAMSTVYVIIFYFKELKLDYTTIALFNVAYGVTYLITMGFWGKIIDRYGCRPVLVICSKLLIAVPFIIILSSLNYRILFIMSVFAGICAAGLELAQFNIILKLAPKEERAMYIGFNTMVVSIFTAVAPIIGGLIVDLIGKFNYKFLFLTWTSYLILFFIAGIARCFPVMFLKNVKEPKEEKVEEVLRIIMSGFGPGFKEGMGILIQYAAFPVTTLGRFIEHLKGKEGKK